MRAPNYTEFNRPLFIDTGGRQYRWPLPDADPERATALATSLQQVGSVRTSEGPYPGTETAVDALLWWRVPRTPLTRYERQRLSAAEIARLERSIEWPQSDETYTLYELATGRTCTLTITYADINRAGGARGWRHTGWLVARELRWLDDPPDDTSVFLRWLERDV